MNKFWFLLSSLYGSLKEYVDEQISKGGGGSGSGLPAVTSEDNGDILSVVDGAWAKGEPGYKAVTVDGTVIVPERTVETENAGTFYVARINDFNRDLVRGWLNNGTKPDSLPVTFNGVKYTAPTTQIETTSGGVTQFYCGEVDGEGVPVFTTYPFCVQFYKEVSEDETVWGVNLFTQSAGSFTIKIAEEVRTAIPTEDFKLAVNNSYVVTSEVDVVPEQTVEAADQGGYVVADLTNAVLPSTPPETLSVTLNGTVYEAAAQFRGDDVMYGDQTLQSVPFMIAFFNGMAQMLVPEAGSYAVHATAEGESVNPKFQEAVTQSGTFTVRYDLKLDQSTGEISGITCDKTFDQIYAACESGQALQAIVTNTAVGETYFASLTQARNGLLYWSSIYFSDFAGSDTTLQTLMIRHDSAESIDFIGGDISVTNATIVFNGGNSGGGGGDSGMTF